jgi:hypothetical protein
MEWGYDWPGLETIVTSSMGFLNGAIAGYFSSDLNENLNMYLGISMAGPIAANGIISYDIGRKLVERAKTYPDDSPVSELPAGVVGLGGGGIVGLTTFVGYGLGVAIRANQ